MRSFPFVIALSALIAPALLAQDSFRVKVVGSGPPIIMIPGLSSSGETWDSTVARYSGRFECHVLTLAGFAGVPRVESPGGSMLSKVREDLASYIRSKALRQPVLIGHSLGGYIALDFASHYPADVSRLVIVDAYPFMMGVDPSMTLAQAKVIAAQVRQGIRGMTQDAYEAYAKSGVSTNSLVTSEPDQKRLIEWALASDRASVADALAEMMSADLREDVAKIRAPTLILAAWRGNEDVGANYQVVEKNMHEQYAKLAGAEIRVSDTARHFIMWDDPQWMFAHLDRFLGVK